MTVIPPKGPISIEANALLGGKHVGEPYLLPLIDLLPGDHVDQDRAPSRAGAGSAAAVTITCDDIFSSCQPHDPTRDVRRRRVRILARRRNEAILHGDAVAPRRQLEGESAIRSAFGFASVALVESRRLGEQGAPDTAAPLGSVTRSADFGLSWFCERCRGSGKNVPRTESEDNSLEGQCSLILFLLSLSRGS